MPFAQHDVFTDPPAGTSIWRYIDLDKFESLLSRRALFFCRADRFADPYEGSSPFRDVTARPAGIASSLASFLHHRRSGIVVCCWRWGYHESDAMWQLYLKDSRGVALRSTPDRLKAAVACSPLDINIGKVRYLDYDQDIFYDPEEFPIGHVNASIPFVHKRIQFAHENEYRAVAKMPTVDGRIGYDWSGEEFEMGVLIDVDIKKLIVEVVLPPHSDEQHAKEVETLVANYKFDFPIRRSEMEKAPAF